MTQRNFAEALGREHGMVARIELGERRVDIIEIFDVLGKKIYSTSLFGKELNISKLTPGIYILKIKENNSSATRKLVVR